MNPLFSSTAIYLHPMQNSVAFNNTHCRFERLLALRQHLQNNYQNLFKLIGYLQFLVLFILSFNCMAVEYKKFDDIQKEQTYQLLINELRCLVCQNQTIADSNAALAKDLRRQVYEMLQQGQSQQQIADFMTARYGDFVLYNPPFKLKTGLLWIGPVIFLLLGLVILILLATKKNKPDNRTLSDIEQIKATERKLKISKLLKQGDKK